MQPIASEYPDRMFIDVFARFQQPIENYAAVLLQDVEEGKDITAEMFLALYKQRESFHTAEQMKSYAFKCTRNACFNRLKSIKRRRNRQTEVLQYLYRPGTVDMMDALMETTETLLNRAIISLDMKYRAIICLYYFENLTYREIACKLKLSPPAIRYRLMKGTALVKAALT